MFRPRALAAFVKRPQAALLKSALGTFYKSGSGIGQTNVIAFFPALLGTLFSTEQKGRAPVFPRNR
jgi:hypothetical protein